MDIIILVKDGKSDIFFYVNYMVYGRYIELVWFVG